MSRNSRLANRICRRFCNGEKTETLGDIIDEETAPLRAKIAILTQSRDNWECACKANDAVVSKLRAALAAHNIPCQEKPSK